MQKQIKILLTLLTALILAVSCAKNNVTNPTKTKEQMLQQKWIDSYKSVYTITATSFENTYLDNNTQTYKVSYAISIEEIAWNADNTSGIIYGKYTINNNNKDYVGKYYAVSFKGLTDSEVSISGAANDTGEKDPNTGWNIYDSAAESLEEAKTKFTEANNSFAAYTTCTVKQ